MKGVHFDFDVSVGVRRRFGAAGAAGRLPVAAAAPPRRLLRAASSEAEQDTQANHRSEFLALNSDFSSYFGSQRLPTVDRRER